MPGGDAHISSVRIARPGDGHTSALDSVANGQSLNRALRFRSWRHALGLALLTLTIFLWTASNFLASTIFANDEYTKPYFVAYLNTSFFMIPLLPMLFCKACSRQEGLKIWGKSWKANFLGDSSYAPLKQDEETSASSVVASAEASVPSSTADRLRSPSEELLLGEPPNGSQIFNARTVKDPRIVDPPLTFRETARVSLEFCVLWFIANYFAGACLQYTTVASATILNSTCSVFTLIFGAIFRVERLTSVKTLGVLASLAGIVLVSLVDLSGHNSDDQHRGDFPEKRPSEIAIGNAMALLAAIIYGAYAVFMKKRIGDESRVNMQLFFGLIGVFNVLILWPGFFILHFIGIERAQLPPTSRVTMILLCNAAASLISDISWVYAVLLTSPIVVTVGLSITIPLSLIGQILLNNQTVDLWYWIGALVVVLSFILVNQEEKKDEVLSIVDGASTENSVE